MQYTMTYRTVNAKKLHEMVIVVSKLGRAADIIEHVLKVGEMIAEVCHDFFTHVFFLKLHLQIHDVAKPIVGLLNGLFEVCLIE